MTENWYPGKEYSRAELLETENARLRRKLEAAEARISELSWGNSSDRMGGGFSDWELNRRGDEFA